MVTASCFDIMLDYFFFIQALVLAKEIRKDAWGIYI